METNPEIARRQPAGFRPTPLAGFPRVTIPGVDTTTEATALYAAGKTATAVHRANVVQRFTSLAKTGRHIYRDTVTAKDKAARRKSDRFAAASRKANR